jgi:TATA-box binding protein (TBP) (component of TFIID and TFIIIB)
MTRLFAQALNQTFPGLLHRVSRARVQLLLTSGIKGRMVPHGARATNGTDDARMGTRALPGNACDATQ